MRTPPAPKALRADAQRNRQRMLEVAEQVFADQGTDIPIDEIARRAGIGVGTIYRHFPTKQALCSAIASERMAWLAARAGELAEADDPDRAFFQVIELLSVEFRRKKDLNQALAGVDVAALTADSKARMRTAVTRLLHRAQAAGAVRADLVYEDIIALVIATIPSPPRAPGDPERLLAVICAGLRPPAPASPPVSPAAPPRPARSRAAGGAPGRGRTAGARSGRR
ncbi:MAG TPA: TetR/AcrR family transcriptional regulator [Kofleriaceae bacterium]